MRLKIEFNSVDSNSESSLQKPSKKADVTKHEMNFKQKAMTLERVKSFLRVN